MSKSLSEAQPIEAKQLRLFFIDNLRIALISLVVLHHVATMYQDFIGFNINEPPDSGLTTMRLVAFLIFNQAFFMGLFFFVSGYFTPGSFDRKGAGPFMKNKLITLGIPFLLYMFVLSPISWLPDALSSQGAVFTWERYFSMVQPGPLWFALLLLIFNFGYLLWRKAARHFAEKPSRSNSNPLKIQAVCLFVSALAAFSYLFRIDMTVYTTFLFFPCFGYFPQYVSFFILGILASRRDWLLTLSDKLGMIGFAAAVASVFTLFPAAYGNILSPSVFYDGGGTWQSGIFALWDSTFAVGMCLALITFFRRFFNQQSDFGRFLSKHTFAVYVFHLPIVVYLAVLVHYTQLPHLLRLSLTAVLSLPVCFAFAYLIRKMPYADRIL